MREFMEEALLQARIAFSEDEVPIGCVIVHDNKIIVREHNSKIKDNNSLMHAEIKAINSAQKLLNTKYLYDCTMYVTLEPCAMCAGAMVNARLGKLIYALEEPKTGCCGSVMNLLDGKFNHRVEVEKGLCSSQSKELMQEFFKNKRSNK